MGHFLTATVAAIAILFLTFASQSETISPKDSYSNVGVSTTVEGVVSQVSTTNSGTTFINFGGLYPNHIFYAVIFRSVSGQFGGVKKLEGRTVAINGTVDLYKGKPQIILNSPDQIRVIN